MTKLKMGTDEMREVAARWAQRLRLGARHFYAVPLLSGPYRRCPVCERDTSTPEHKDAYRTLLRCRSCDHVYSSRFLGPIAAGVLYSGQGYWVQDRVHQGITSIDAGPHWQGYLRARMEILERTGVLGTGRKRIFEIGCSEGILLRALTDRGHATSGCEMNRHVAQEGVRRLSVNIEPRSFENVSRPDGQFDTIISFHTLEHLRFPGEVVSKACRMLRSDGCLLLEVPCGKAEYANYDHFHFFSKQSLSRLLDKCFSESSILENTYINAGGEAIGSLYGVGRSPRPALVEPRG